MYRQQVSLKSDGSPRSETGVLSGSDWGVLWYAQDGNLVKAEGEFLHQLRKLLGLLPRVHNRIKLSYACTIAKQHRCRSELRSTQE